jgi:UDP-N-acetyl-D-glucosamine/UDP-N-acetyl-D-galactosamine dehydrogenase
MSLPHQDDVKIAVIGLGYVGLPLSRALSMHYPLTGFDIDAARISELKQGIDRTGEMSGEMLRGSRIDFSDDAAELASCNIFIITVPTPVDDHQQPDLSIVKAACATIAPALRTGAVVVLESTVYPGVTEDICGPELAAGSGLTAGMDFFLGFSPERINPGDKEHTVSKITKVVAGQTPAVTDFLAQIYGAMTEGNVFKAKNIRTAEAAKVIENAQRDINIAFANEVAMIFDHMGLNSADVFAAANTKWNFIDFKPGLVGGHCIGVDPFYLAHAAREMGHEPEVILAGRRINDGMAKFAANRIAQELDQLPDGNSPRRVLVLGLTFKENVPDLRNSKAADLIAALKGLGHGVDVHDEMADPARASREYGIDLLEKLPSREEYDCVVGAVSHAAYCAFDGDRLAGLLRSGGVVADIKGIWRHIDLGQNYRRWEL